MTASELTAALAEGKRQLRSAKQRGASEQRLNHLRAAIIDLDRELARRAGRLGHEPDRDGAHIP